MSIDYTAKKISSPIQIDGNIQKPIWDKAKWSPNFVDMVTGAPGMYHTQSAILWNETHLYIAFQLEEPNVSATLTERDSILFMENNVEILIDGGDCYYELQVNALNTVYEVFFIWKDTYTRGSRFDIPKFDVHHPSAYTFGGDDDRTPKTFWTGSHPRGIRWAFTNFDMPGLETAVSIDGTINDPNKIDKGWSIEMAIPWSSLEILSNGRTIPPKNGDVWQIFLGRFEKLIEDGKEVMPHPAMVLRSHGVYNTHLPDQWSSIQFEA